MGNKLGSFLSQIDRLLELPESEINRASKLGAAISGVAIELKNFSGPDGKGAELERLASAVDAAAKKLELSVLNSKKGGTLRVDWSRFARLDFQRLKDEVLAFREFLVVNSDSLKDFLRFDSLQEVNLEGLVKELHRERLISERTWAIFMCRISECGSKKVLKDSNLARQLARILRWRSEFRELKGGEHVGQEA